MKTLAILGTIGVLVLFFVVGYFGFQNTANVHENGIIAQYDVNKNVYDNGWKEIKEMAQIPDMYTGQLEKLYKVALEGRYGADGSKAMMQFIQEQNPTIDSSLFRQIQQSIEIFRKRFTAEQTALVSRKQAYRNYLTGTFSGRLYNSIAGGYPKIDMTKYDIVTSDKTEEDFGTKRSRPLDFKQD
ncbi:MAG: hypothetical protein HYT37_02410 [Candidatus Sungbacteria bacterium]|nr:hypothetical protein [Candidatus Sungbacteria bacterium]